MGSLNWKASRGYWVQETGLNIFNELEGREELELSPSYLWDLGWSAIWLGNIRSYKTFWPYFFLQEKNSFNNCTEIPCLSGRQAAGHAPQPQIVCTGKPTGRGTQHTRLWSVGKGSGGGSLITLNTENLPSVKSVVQPATQPLPALLTSYKEQVGGNRTAHSNSEVTSEDPCRSLLVTAKTFSGTSMRRSSLGK